MQTIFWLIVLALGITGGVAFGYQLRKLWAVRRKDTIETKVEALLNEAKAKQKEILLEANDKALRVLEEAKSEEKNRKQELERQQQRLESREGLFDKKILELENKKQGLIYKADKVEKIKAEILKIKEDQLAKLEKVANLTREEAQRVLIENTEQQIKNDLFDRMKKLSAQSNLELDRKAKEMLTLAIQRCAVSHAAEGTTTTMNLPSV